MRFGISVPSCGHLLMFGVNLSPHFGQSTSTGSASKDVCFASCGLFSSGIAKLTEADCFFDKQSEVQFFELTPSVAEAASRHFCNSALCPMHCRSLLIVPAGVLVSTLVAIQGIPAG